MQTQSLPFPDFCSPPSRARINLPLLINYILFDADYVPIEAKSVPVGNSPNTLHEIELPQIQVKELGHLFIYLSYDNESTSWVHFDDFKIDYEESPVIQVNGYYPYGMTAYSWVRDGEEEARERFQGKEYDSLTRWHDFHARQYDAALGRWFVTDPESQFGSPYLGMGNNPVNGSDPDGQYFVLDDIVAAAVGGVSNLITNGVQGNLGGHGFWATIGRGLAAFGAGAVGGVGAIYPEAGGWLWGGAVVGATNAWLSGATKPGDIAMGAATGAVTSVVGGTIGRALAPAITSATNVVTSPVLKGAIGGAIGGTITGGAIGGFGALATGGNFWNGVGQGAFTGFATGTTSGMISAGVTARSRGFNPLTGERITAPNLDVPRLQLQAPKLELKPKIKPLTGDLELRPQRQFIVAPDGQVIEVPPGYYSAPTRNGKGLIYRPIGSTSNANAIRVMGGTAYAPNGYVVFYNSNGQPINPQSGVTLPRSQWHFEFRK